MDCCAFQRLSKPWPKQNDDGKRGFAPKHPHVVFHNKNSCKVYVRNQTKELDPYLYIIAVEILKIPTQSPCHQKCKSSSLYSCTCLSKKHMSMYSDAHVWQKEALPNNLLTRTSNQWDLGIRTCPWYRKCCFGVWVCVCVCHLYQREILGTLGRVP